MYRRRLLVALAGLVAVGVASALLSMRSQASDDLVLPLTFTRRAVIGGSEDTVLALRSLYPNGIGVDAADRIYVLDAAEHRVVVFDAAGKRLATRGGPGGGPGEVQNSFSAHLAVSASGAVWIYDRGKRSLVGFGTDGAPLSEIPLTVGGLLWGLAVDDSHGILLLTNRGDSIVLRRVSGEREDTLAVKLLPSRRPLAAERCGLAGHTDRPIFSGTLPWASRGGTVAFTVSDSFAVTARSGTGEPFHLRRSRLPSLASAELAARTMPRGWSIEIAGQRSCTIPAAEVVAQLGFATTIPGYSELVLDGRGQLWALRVRLSGEPRSADVFDLALGYVGTVMLGDVHPVAFLSDGSVVSLEIDDNDAPTLVIYEVGGN